MEWDDVRIFLAIARTGTVTAAAENLGCNPSTVTRRIAQLEAQLKVKLFERHKTGYVPTTAGLTLRDDALRIEQQLVALAHRVSARDKEYSGTIIFSSGSAVFGRIFAPYLPEFHRRYPDIVVEVVDDDTPMDVFRREADVVLRTSAEPPSHLVGRRLGQVRMRPFASTAYAEHVGRGSDISVIVGSGPGEQELIEWASTMGPARVALRTDSRELRIRAACAGLGVMMLTEAMGDAEPTLTRIRGDVPTTLVDLWLLTHPDLRKSERVRVFQDFLLEAIARGGGVGIRDDVRV